MLLALVSCPPRSAFQRFLFILPRPTLSGSDFATLGSYWQIEALEVGYVRRLSRGLAAISLTGRIGTFMNETAVTGSSRGMAFITTLGARTRMKRIAQAKFPMSAVDERHLRWYAAKARRDKRLVPAWRRHAASLPPLAAFGPISVSGSVANVKSAALPPAASRSERHSPAPWAARCPAPACPATLSVVATVR
jgi:hypothetical protein